MNNHQDNISDLVIEYGEKHGMSQAQMTALMEDDATDEILNWLDTKTDTAIKGIEYG